jgi:hypothetical protein
VISLTIDVASPAPPQRTTTLLWAATPGRLYRVQTKPGDLIGPWIDLPGDVLATATTATKTHVTSAVDPTHSYYRVQLVP